MWQKDTGLMTSAVITEWVSIAAFGNSAGLPVGVGLSGVDTFFCLAITIP